MILSSTSIQQAIDDGRVVIDPEPGPRIATRGQPTPYGSSAVDLHLSDRLRVPIQGLSVEVNPGIGSVQDTLATLYRQENIPTTGFNLHPWQLVLSLTAERVKLSLPNEIDEDVRDRGWLAARVEGKSSLARYGLLVHFTAPTIHAGFEGRIALEMMNLGPSPIILTQGMAICQLILEQVHGVPAAPASRFAGQTDPAGTT